MTKKTIVRFLNGTTAEAETRDEDVDSRGQVRYFRPELGVCLCERVEMTDAERAQGYELAFAEIR